MPTVEQMTPRQRRRHEQELARREAVFARRTAKYRAGVAAKNDDRERDRCQEALTKLDTWKARGQ